MVHARLHLICGNCGNGDNDFSGLYAQIKCNYDETRCYAAYLPDIEVDND